MNHNKIRYEQNLTTLAVHRSDLGGLTALLQQEEKRYKTVTQKCQDIESNTFEEYLSVVNEISALRTGTIACHIRARPLYYYCILFYYYFILP